MEGKDVLDYDLNTKNRKSYYSKRSLVLLLISSVLIAFNVFILLAQVSSYPLSRIFLNSMPILAVLFSITVVLGFFFAIASVVKREKNSLMKIFGLIGNAIFFLLFVMGRIWQFVSLLN